MESGTRALRYCVKKSRSDHLGNQDQEKLSSALKWMEKPSTGFRGNKPEWIGTDPYCPCATGFCVLLVPLDGGRFATRDLNDLYRRRDQP